MLSENRQEAMKSPLLTSHGYEVVLSTLPRIEDWVVCYDRLSPGPPLIYLTPTIYSMSPSRGSVSLG